MDFPHPSADALQIWFFCQPGKLVSLQGGEWIGFRNHIGTTSFLPTYSATFCFFVLGKSVIFEHAHIFWDANYLNLSHSEIPAVKLYLFRVTSRDLQIIIHPPNLPRNCTSQPYKLRHWREVQDIGQGEVVCEGGPIPLGWRILKFWSTNAWRVPTALLLPSSFLGDG